MNVAQSPSTTFPTCITLHVLYRNSGTALPKGGFFKGDMRDSEAHWRRNAGTWKLCSEDCNNFYCIESVENCADELKAIFFACWNNQVNWAARKDLSKTRSSRLVSYLLFKVTQKVPSFPSISIFTSLGRQWELFCLNRWKYPIRTQERSSVPSIWMVISQDDWLYAGLQRQGRKSIGCLLGTRVVMWVIHFNQ